VSGDPAVTEVLHTGRVSVFRINGELSASGCSKGENLHGKPVQAGGSAANK
jgi:hypothetical protein